MRDDSTSFLKKRIPRSVGCLVVLVLCAGIWALFEVQAQKTVLADALAVYRDPDHRLNPLDEGVGTNSDGLRCRFEAGEIADSDFIVLFFGDSFVFGPNVGREGALPSLFEKGLRGILQTDRIQVVNAAWPSASPLLALRLLHDIGARYRPDLVLYGFDMTDFRDDLMYRNLIDKKGLYRMVDLMPASLWLIGRGAKAGAPEGLYRFLFRMPKDRFFCVNQPLVETRRDLLPAWNSLEEINRFSRDELNADFHVIVLPRNFQYSDRESPSSWERGDYEILGPSVLDPFRFFDQQAGEALFRVHSLLPAFQKTDVFPTCYSADPHWTPAGTQVAADAVVAMAVDGGWVPDSADPGGRKLSSPNR